MGAKKVDGLLVEHVEGELLVVKTSSNEAHALNEAASIVFDLCDGSTSREAMAAEVKRRTGLPADEGVVDLALAELTEAGLIAKEDETPSITRRSLIRRLTLPAAVAALLPVVETVLLPTTASAASLPAPPLPSPSPTPSPG